MHAKSRPQASRTGHLQGMSMAITWIAGGATFGAMVAHERIFHILRIAIALTSIVDTYSVVQARCRSSGASVLYQPPFVNTNDIQALDWSIPVTYKCILCYLQMVGLYW
jgi:hypothetical protein